MSSNIDAFADWDAAYVLGALSARERRDFEQHLRDCPRCATSVAELAGMPGLLARVPAADLGVGDPDGAGAVPLQASTPVSAPMPTQAPDLVTVTASAPGRRFGARRIAITASLAAAAAVTVLAIALGGSGGSGAGGPEPAAAQTVHLASTGQTALSADVRLDRESWGTAVSTHCRYGSAPAEDGAYPGTADGTAAAENRYGLYVTDRDGESRLVSSWSAAPGSDIRADGSTDVPIEQIAVVDIRAIDTGHVLLESAVGVAG